MMLSDARTLAIKQTKSSWRRRQACLLEELLFSYKHCLHLIKANSWTLVTYFLKNLKEGQLGANQH